MFDTKEEALQDAVFGLSMVADALSAVPDDMRSRALRAVEDSYRQSAHDLGCDDRETQSWVDAIMFRLRSEVSARRSTEEAEPAVAVTVNLTNLSAA